jgi:hypothetical protein
MDVYYINTVGNDQNAIHKGMNWLIQTKSSGEKAVVGLVIENLKQLFTLLKIKPERIAYILDKGMFRLPTEETCRMFTDRTLREGTFSTGIVIYPPPRFLEKVLSKSGIESLLVIPWKSSDIQLLISKGAQEYK